MKVNDVEQTINDQWHCVNHVFLITVINGMNATDIAECNKSSRSLSCNNRLIF